VNKKLAIAAVCSRPFVSAAAAAGYQVIALDAFADADTQRAAFQTYQLKYADGHFDTADFERVLNSLPTDAVAGEFVGLVYGSGFEPVPELLEMAARQMPLIGNTPRVLRNLKRPRQFFMLLEVLQIPHPEVSFKPLGPKSKEAGWLYKQAGGSGGTHIRKALPIASLPPETGHYFQREVAGMPISLLFAADGKQARPIGFNQQWVAPKPGMPYRYGGAVSHVELPAEVRKQLLDAAQRLTNAVGLRGLNSLDALMDGEQLWVLEINPRLSATFDLYQSPACNLFDLHIQACTGEIANWPHLPQRAKAHHMIYAWRDMVLPQNVEWPAWAADLPVPGSRIAADNPICTVFADAENAASAHELVLERAQALQAVVENYY